ncbi:1-acyl-sn-glycerol-3-phosphate acyltransferase [Paraburkholderia caballeronis]|uniref:lysophospholipid acyltransferase family protein n=1 Tax=Paraburkholderia caballeronis TaxID=416943 RepID=UPI001066DF2C|nr:lysophospholipid acyltransferase family protein [Paraburkholderia caballeronis]TDV39023.1 1-acyl-sn-glycerol-3-phosphate acyltransferase [Paraburkholderia caballeronis]
MPARLDYMWRFFVTAVSFAAFGVCGLLFSLIVFPLASIWPHRASRQRAVTTVIHWFFRTLVTALQRARVMELDVAGVQALRSGTPAIMVANHPTYIDVVVLLALTPSACCVVKNAHWSNPCLWGIVRAAGYVSNADPQGFVEDCARHLGNGYSMIIFPEGSRSPAPNRLRAFSRGFAHTALEAGVPILPVLMHCDPPAFMKQMRWYHVPERPFRMTVNVLAPIGVERFAPREMPSALAARNVTRAVEAHITQYLFEYGFFKTGN